MKFLSLVTLLFCLSCMEAADNPTPKSKAENPRGEEGNSTQPLEAGQMRAHAFRIKGETQLTYKKMQDNMQLGKEDSYRIVPNPDKDHDKNVTVAKDIGKEKCGIGSELNTIAKRIADCKAKLGVEKTFWEGKVNGISGEGNFTLVVNNEHEIWYDDSTGMVWSDEIEQDDWTNASGEGMPDLSNEKFVCNQIDDITKEEVRWRLPTRADFLQADLNGARYVLPRLGVTYWTATSVDGGNKAWAILQKTGILSESFMSEKHSIRCVGHILK